MSLAPEHLPPLASELAEVVGLAAALALVDGWGGIRLYVPERLAPEHPLAETLGREAAEALCQRYARERLDIPRCAAAVRAARDAEIRARHRRQGESARDLARHYRLTERSIWLILARDPAAAEARAAQGALF